MAERLSVSVLICVRDGEAHLAEAIDSALAQTVPPDEVIVVDDGSRDGSAGLARSYDAPVRCIEQGALGIGAARNAAVAAASGDLVAFLDADDVWEPRKLELQLAAFARDPGLQFVFGHVREFANPGEEGTVSVRPAPVPGALTTTMCARREAIERAGGFATDTRVGEVMAWLLRARELGLRETTLPDLLAHRRVHAENMTRRERSNFGDYAQLLKASLDRRRQST